MEVKPESFTLDHTKVVAPYVRKCKVIDLAGTHVITKFDIRFTQPNKDEMNSAAMHTIEHLIAYEIANDCPWVSIDFSPMGCRTGFYWSILGNPSEEDVKNVLKAYIRRILDTYDDKNSTVPGATEKECGNYRYHDLNGALHYLSLFAIGVDQGHY